MKPAEDGPILCRSNDQKTCMLKKMQSIFFEPPTYPRPVLFCFRHSRGGRP